MRVYYVPPSFPGLLFRYLRESLVRVTMWRHKVTQKPRGGKEASWKPFGARQRTDFTASPRGHRWEGAI